VKISVYFLLSRMVYDLWWQMDEKVMSLYELQNCVLLLYFNILVLSFCIFRERNQRR
jgi:hypothetical protein